MTSAFDLLHPTVQRKLWDMKWTELRQIQVEAIQHLRSGTPTDCIIESPTASGKTEAAFLPVLSAIADEPFGSVRAMYIGPLKALINDQFGRVEQLCERMEMPVCRWHGDVDDGPRKALLARPGGVLLITPESLEAMFVLRPTMLPALFGKLAYAVIDETHAFLGSERGAQLISQLHRLRVRAGCDPIRIGLSATLGDRDAACRWLRRDGRPVRVIASKAGDAEIKLKIRGYWKQEPEGEDDHDPTTVEIARAILLACHGNTNLVFANSKGLIEELADELATQARAMSLGDEIVVHHGSLSKEQRARAEEVLRADRPCTAVCSNTLELGIDIGAIDQVVQVSPPWSVASLVQRIGRSGRRPGAPRILRGHFAEERPSPDATAWDRLFLDFIRGLATIELMLEHWLEPPMVDRANLSTLVQQLLSTLAETGGIRAQPLYARLLESGAFVGVNKGDFAAVLRELGARDLIEQLPDSTLVLGLKGQRIVEHYSFYAAFKAPDEFQVLFRDRVIGTLPESMLPGVGEHVILAGKRWLVDDIDVDGRKVHVSPSRGRRAPRFASGQPDTDPTLHARMRQLLAGDGVPAYVDDVGREVLAEARKAAHEVQLDAIVRDAGERTVLQLWTGTRVFRTLWLVFVSAGIQVTPAGDVAIEINGRRDVWTPVLQRFVDAPDGIALARFAEDRLGARITDGQKFDVFLPSEQWCASYARERLDIPSAVKTATRILAGASGTSRPPDEPPPTLRSVAVTDLTSWADHVMALETRAVLPTRLVLVPSEAHAHALRVELVARHPSALAGTRFLTAAAAARATLDAAGVRHGVGEEVLRPIRIEKIMRTRPSLAAFRVDELATSGWYVAFADTIEQLEAAGLRPDDLAAIEDDRARDLATIWRLVDADAVNSWTLPRIIYEAAAVLEARPQVWPFDAPVLAAVTAGLDAGHARFLRAIPRVTSAVLAGRPARRRALDRITALLGRDAADAMIARGAAARPGELGILAELVFEAPERLGNPSRRRSTGPDGSVSIEVFAGIDEEVDAAVQWVANEVFEHGTPLQDIAVLVPSADPYATLVAERMLALAWPPDVAPVYLAAGLPATATSDGARLLSVMRALEAHLPSDCVVGLLPRLRPTGSDGHVSPGRARHVVTELATLGGSTARPEGALEWRHSLQRVSSNERIAPLVAAIEALVSIAEQMLGRAPLSALWMSVRTFAATHLIGSSRMAELLEQLDADVMNLARDPVTSDVVGRAAMSLLAERLCAMRVQTRRFGDPGIFVGTVSHAAGLRFSAVRVLGLAEGVFPGTLREDAILPAELRRQLPTHTIATEDAYVTGRLHAFAQVIAGVTHRLALSAARTDLDGSEREPASVLIEVAAALGRPDPATGQPSRPIPTRHDLERIAFDPARATARRKRLAAPLMARSWLWRTAVERVELPSTWLRERVANPQEVLDRASSMDGLLGREPLAVPSWGTSAEYPLSASALRILLACPQRFLLERLLGFRPREDPPSGHRIEPMAYGDVFHQVVEAFGGLHGSAFGARERDLAHWLTTADDIALGTYAAFVTTYPMISQSVLESERQRLRRDVKTFLEHDWNGGRPRRFVAVERAFGEKVPVALATSSGPLFVKGWIDRIDVDGLFTLVRDFKTGRPRPRERDLFDPDPDTDLQLALYAAVARELAAAWGIPRDVAASYVYVQRFAGHRERGFYGDREALHAAGMRWLDIAAGLVAAQSYVKTSDASECGRCAFAPVCGGQSAATTSALASAVGPLAAFRDLKS
jgi:ATP-dependent Lhr-like helicase